MVGFGKKLPARPTAGNGGFYARAARACLSQPPPSSPQQARSPLLFAADLGAGKTAGTAMDVAVMDNILFLFWDGPPTHAEDMA